MITDKSNEAKPLMTGSDIKAYLQQLLAQCQSSFEASLDASNLPKVAASHLFANEIVKWSGVLGDRRESELLKVAASEYELGLLSLTQGHYRQSFKALRLVLELILQAVYLSANELCLREWLDNRIDTIWSSIVDPEQGVFSHRFAKAFFTDLSRHVSHYRGLAGSVYRECSECVHGNTPKQVPLQACLGFDQEVFDLWHGKASHVALISHFALSLRYLRDLPEVDVCVLEPFLADHLGHLEEIRQYLGGPTKG